MNEGWDSVKTRLTSMTERYEAAEKREPESGHGFVVGYTAKRDETAERMSAASTVVRNYGAFQRRIDAVPELSDQVRDAKLVLLERFNDNLGRAQGYVEHESEFIKLVKALNARFGL